MCKTIHANITKLKLEKDRLKTLDFYQADNPITSLQRQKQNWR